VGKIGKKRDGTLKERFVASACAEGGGEKGKKGKGRAREGMEKKEKRPGLSLRKEEGKSQ